MAARRWPEKQSARGGETALNACIGVPCAVQTARGDGFGACLALLISISLEQAPITGRTAVNDVDTELCLEACSP